MKTSILSVPVELLNRIFEHCDDFSQVIALASTCKRTHSAWVTNSPRIIWNVASTHIRSFDDALMAVRATANVLDAYKEGILPPAVTMPSLSGNVKLPSLAELKEVLNMQHLVRCIEYMYFHSTQTEQHSADSLFDTSRYPAARRQFPEMLQAELPGERNETMDSFRDLFYRAMYRLLLAGAVLARAYMTPLFQARAEGGKSAFFMRFGIDYWAEDIDDSEASMPTEADIAYLRHFPVYNFDVSDWSELGQWRNEEYETCFGPFASWIIEDGRKRQNVEPQVPEVVEPAWAENSADIGAVRELMLLLVAYDHFNVHFQNEGSSRGGPYLQKLGNRFVTIVRFGYFQVEEVTMPAAVEDLTDDVLYAQYHPSLKGTEGEDIPSQFDVSYTMWLLKQQVREIGAIYRGDNPPPPPMLELWNFALRHYLKLGFKSGTFKIPLGPSGMGLDFRNSTWYKEVGGGEIFRNPNWAAVQKYKPGVLSWEPEND